MTATPENGERQPGKLRVGVYWASSCGGCDISVLEIAEHLLELIEIADIVFWPCVTDFKYATVAGYPDDLGQESGTETFVAIKAHVDNWRWQGVPFYLRHGKRLAERRSEIVVQFKDVPHNIFAGRGGRPRANRLVIRLQPEEYVRMQVMAKEPGLDRGGITLREVNLDLSLTTAFARTRRRIAYERLLLDLIESEQTLFVRRDEVEAQWRWVDAIRAVWAEEAPDAIKPYAAGGWGPNAAIALTERDGRSWND